MIDLPDFNNAFDYENGFYLSTNATRMGKLLAHLELFKMTNHLPGAIVECGVFKGASLARFAIFRNLFSIPLSRKIVGFDIFGTFPETDFEQDKENRERFIGAAGDQSISTEQMMQVMENNDCATNVELVKGDICKTIPEYIETHPEFRISLLNLDVDIYEPSVAILENLYPRIVQGGVLILDDYAEWPGETKAVDDYFKDQGVVIRKFPYCQFPSYIIKE